LFPPFSRLLSLDRFILHIGHILGGTLPVGIEDEALVMLGL
jgi:hypothetical protein